MSSPWEFGWTQALAIIGLLIAGFGLRTFDRWRKEKIEEKRIEVAIKTLELASESISVFEAIRRTMTFPHEWQDMPSLPTGDTEQRRQQRGPYYVALKNIEARMKVFERARKLQVQCSALFGRTVEELFRPLFIALARLRTSADMLYRRDPLLQQSAVEFWNGRAADVAPPLEGDEIERMLVEFRAGIEGLCRPIVQRGYGIGSDVNWQRGLFRLWLMASVCWIGFVGWIAYLEFEHYFDDLIPVRGGVADYAARIIVPILSTLVLGLMAAWVSAGFGRKETRPPSA
jgi:hypothetical protein